MSKYEVEISAWGNYFKGRCEIDKIMADFMLENQHKKTYKIKMKQITEANTG